MKLIKINNIDLNKHKKYANLHIERNGDKRWKFHRRTEKKQLKK